MVEILGPPELREDGQVAGPLQIWDAQPPSLLAGDSLSTCPRAVPSSCGLSLRLAGWCSQ